MEELSAIVANTKDKTIYVSIPSLDDAELIPTIHDAMDKAADMGRVHIGVALQSSDKKMLKEVQKVADGYLGNVQVTFTKLTTRNAPHNLGVGLGRAKAHSFYNNEDYFLQVDSHTMFEQDWDEKLIQMLRHASDISGNPKTIITAYAGSYFLDENGGRTLNFPNGLEEHSGFYYPLYSQFERRNSIPSWDIVPFGKISDRPEPYFPAPKFNANFAFGPSEFATNLGLEPNFIFFEEEVIQTVNLMTAGWSLAFPNVETATIRHLYGAKGESEKTMRKAAGHYLRSDAELAALNGKSRQNYQDFLAKEDRKKYLESYERYAKVSLKYGRQTPDTMPPEYWALDVFTDEEISQGTTPCASSSDEPHEHDHPHDQETAEGKVARPWDLLNPNIGRVSDEVRESRLSICESCPFYVKLTKQCTKCGCFMPAKTGLPHASCPEHKWDAVPDEG